MAMRIGPHIVRKHPNTDVYRFRISALTAINSTLTLIASARRRRSSSTLTRLDNAYPLGSSLLSTFPPTQLNMEDQDEIDAMIEQLGGC